MKKKHLLIIFFLCSLYSCDKIFCNDCGEPGLAATFKLQNNSSYILQFYIFDTLLKSKTKLLKTIVPNGNLNINIFFQAGNPIYDSLFLYPLQVNFENKKYVIVPKVIGYKNNFYLSSGNTYNNYNGFQYSNNYTKINDKLFVYYFTEKDYLMADTIIN